MKLTATLFLLAYAFTGCQFCPASTVAKSAQAHKGQIIAAIVQTESGGDCSAIGDNGQAVGAFQIHPIMVREVNRIAGTRFKLSDRLDYHCSLLMFYAYTNHYTPSWDAEKVARRWVSGPRGDTKPASLPYWKKVRRCL